MGKNGKIDYRMIDNSEKDVFKLVFRNIEPYYTDTFTIYSDDIFYCGKDYVYNHNPMKLSKNDFSYNHFKIDEEKLLLYTDSQLRLLRNSFYAIHGYHFKSEDLQEYFSTEDWRKFPGYNDTFSEANFNEVEKYNIELIQKVESERKKQRKSP